MNYVLDACALMAYLAEERGGGYEMVDGLFNRLEEEAFTISMHTVNLIEVYYGFIQKCNSLEQADAIMTFIDDLPISFIDTIPPVIYRETARIKALYALSFADAFACATAKSLSATLVTKDREIKAVEQRENLPLLWIR